MVMVLEAPLFKAPQENAPIVQHLRKGETANFYWSDRDPTFYQTIDRNGRAAYVLKRHIKLITADEREAESPITSFLPDRTDYRIPEPLPEGYPIRRRPKSRGLLAIGMATPSGQTYPYRRAAQQLDSTPRAQLHLQYTREASFDPYASDPRLYWGGFLRFAFGGTQAQFATGEQAQENSTLFSLGPMLSYDFFRRGPWQVVASGGVGLDLINTYRVEIDDESQAFGAFTITPTLSLHYQHRQVLQGVSLSLGITCDLVLPQELRSADLAPEGDLWRDGPAFPRDFSLDLALTMGIQYSP